MPTAVLPDFPFSFDKNKYKTKNKYRNDIMNKYKSK
jgi:hypothetical protein